MLVDDRELTQRAVRVEELLGEIETFPDPVVRQKMAETVGELVVLYGEGLARILAIVQQVDGETGARILEAFAEDELIAHLLMLHDLHPIPLETRIAAALDGVRPYLQSHGGEVELLGVEDGVARLRLQGSCSGCPSSTVTLKLAIEEAITRAAPDLLSIEAEGVVPPPSKPVNFLPTSEILSLKPKRNAESLPAWVTVDRSLPLGAGDMQPQVVGDVPVVFLQVDDTLYAYRNHCPQCGWPLDAGVLAGDALSCGGCGHRYDVRQAGRSLDMQDRYLDPFPLLVDSRGVHIALPGNNGDA